MTLHGEVDYTCQPRNTSEKYQTFEASPAGLFKRMIISAAYSCLVGMCMPSFFTFSLGGE